MAGRFTDWELSNGVCLVVKNLPPNAGAQGLVPESERSPGVGNGNPLQYSCLETSHGQKNLEDYSPRVRKESDPTLQLSTAI